MPIPNNLRHDLMVAAMDSLGPDSSKWPKHRHSRQYDVIHPDPNKRWPMPPKLVISEAYRLATGQPLSSELFNGGYGKGRANTYLEGLHFRIVTKTGRNASAGR